MTLQERYNFNASRIKNLWLIRNEEHPFHGAVKAEIKWILKCMKEYRDRINNY